MSHVMFVTTANTLDTIPAALLDRMEVIQISGYTSEEKLHIAKNHLVPKQMKRHGLKPSQLLIEDDTIIEIIEHYTREAGVRNLERELAGVCRKAAKALVADKKRSIIVTPATRENYLGKQKYHFDKVDKEDEIGVVRGLAWTSVGGDTLSVEVNIMPGTGRIELTGQLGDVMKESRARQSAISVPKQIRWELSRSFIKKRIFIFTCQRALYRKTVPQPVSRWHAR